MFKPPKPQAKLDKYIDPTGEFTNRDLKLGEWYVRHKIMLREIVVGALITFVVVVGGYGLYRWVEYLIVGYSADERNRADLTRNAIPFSKLRERQAPLPLELGSVYVFSATPGRYDFLAETTNGNEDWWLDVTYRFVHNAGQTTTTVARIMPASRLPLTVIGVSSDTYPGNVRLEIVATNWQRVDPHEVANPLAYLAERRQFAVADFVFTPAASGQSVPSHTVRFTLINNSIYSYWQPVFFVLYKSGGELTGFKRIVADKLLAKEKREVEIMSLSEGLVVDTVEVLPAVDFFSESEFTAL